MLASLVSFALSLNLISLVQAQTVDPYSDPNIWKFRSRPDLYPTRIFVDTNEPGVTPGYIFTGIYQGYQNSAAIYDLNGEVVWFGFGSTGAGQSFSKPVTASLGALLHHQTNMQHRKCPQLPALFLQLFNTLVLY